ncbi:MAG: hypothetical protein A2X46_06005 [Lentisphaerae bacterium GWF2_57_35]|nr:MAG: hypothetical protein A2X46_06005 [Lentisphaerae bacterium GWF2_57_35]
MSMLWRQYRKRAFTLIELLVVIAIIALLAAILTPAISKALVRGRLTQAVGNGTGLYKLMFSAELDNPMQLKAKGNADWPKSADWPSGDSSAFFAAIVTNTVFGGAISYNFFALSGIEAAQTEAEFLDGKIRNAWCIALDVSDTMPASTPTIFTQNIKLNGNALNQFVGIVDTVPFGKRGSVVVQRGGGALILDENTALGTNFNATGQANTSLYPKNSVTSTLTP